VKSTHVSFIFILPGVRRDYPAPNFRFRTKIRPLHSHAFFASRLIARPCEFCYYDW